jgi:hypothetical protein
MKASQQVGPAIPDGYITKKKAAELIGVSPKSVERICKASQQTDNRIRWMTISNPGTRSITIYHKEDLLKYRGVRRVAASGGTEPPDSELLIAHLDRTLGSLGEMVRREITRGSRSIRAELQAGRGPSRVHIALVVGQAE